MTATKTELVSAQYSSDATVAYEQQRLTKFSRVEFEITKRVLRRHLAPLADEAARIGRPLCVVDTSCAHGHYAEFIATAFPGGVEIIACDITPLHVAKTLEHMTQAGLASAVREHHVVDARHLDGLDGVSVEMRGKVDAVLLFGPLYHLLERSERLAAVRAARNVLRTGGVIFAAGINGHAMFRDLLHYNFMEPSKEAEYLERFFSDEGRGRVEAEFGAPIGVAYLGDQHVLREELLADKLFEEIDFVGTEACLAQELNQLALYELLESSDEQKRCRGEAFLDALERHLARTEAGRTLSDHLLFVGRAV